MKIFLLWTEKQLEIYRFHTWTARHNMWDKHTSITWTNRQTIAKGTNKCKYVYNWLFKLCTLHTLYSRVFTWKLTLMMHVYSRWCNIHVHQFWWMWPLRFRRYWYFQKWPNFPFNPWTIDLWLNSNNWQTLCFLTHIHLQAENYSLNNNCLHSNLHVIMLTKVTMQLASSITC